MSLVRRVCVVLLVVLATAQAESVHREVLANGLVLVVQELQE